MPLPAEVLAAMRAKPVASGIGQSRTLYDRLALLNYLMRLGIWPQQDIPNFGPNADAPLAGLPVPDMPNLGFERPGQDLTDPGMDFQMFYSPGSADLPKPILQPWPGAAPLSPYPQSPREGVL